MKYPNIILILKINLQLQSLYSREILIGLIKFTV